MASPRAGSPLSLLSGLKAAQLRAIAIATGINSGGTKPILAAHLENELLKDPFPKTIGTGGQESNARRKNGNHPSQSKEAKEAMREQQYQHVLSIDMGIRNLAYCRMLVPAFENQSAAAGPQSPSRIIPIIMEWKRVAVSSHSAPSLAVPLDEDKSVPAAKEPFDPLTYSRLAHSLIISLLQPSPPPIGPVTQILIERQRYRSMGSSSVQEWTLRVNMFEAMLYAVLCTLSEMGYWEGRVWPVQPSKVWGYWSEGVEKAKEAKVMSKGSKAARTKKEKIDKVGQWLVVSGIGLKHSKLLELGEDHQVSLDEGGKETGQKYLEKWKGRRGSGDVGKLDDLADCLLQGVAWVRWEETKKRILQKGGLEAFLDGVI